MQQPLLPCRITHHTDKVVIIIYVFSSAPLAPPTNLVVYNETITTLNARWNPAPGRVQNYRITYVPTSGGRTQTVSQTLRTGNLLRPVIIHMNRSKNQSKCLTLMKITSESLYKWSGNRGGGNVLNWIGNVIFVTLPKNEKQKGLLGFIYLFIYARTS